MSQSGETRVTGGGYLYLGSATTDTLEGKILTGGVDAVREMQAQPLLDLVRTTKNREVAAIVLEMGDEELSQKLMQIYTHGHHGEKWLERHRIKGMREEVKALQRLHNGGLVSRTIGYIRERLL